MLCIVIIYFSRKFVYHTNLPPVCLDDALNWLDVFFVSISASFGS